MELVHRYEDRPNSFNLYIPYMVSNDQFDLEDYIKAIRELLTRWYKKNLPCWSLSLTVRPIDKITACYISEKDIVADMKEYAKIHNLKYGIMIFPDMDTSG